MTTTTTHTAEERAAITRLALHRMAFSAPDSEVSQDMRDTAFEAMKLLADRDGKPGPAARLRRLAVIAAGSRLSAATARDKATATGRMYAYVSALNVLAEAGIADEGIAPHEGTYEDPRALAELTRFTGEQNARDLGLT